ncbi:hypothetical protein [Caballeronia arvi]|uniref:hypothetical protein n=1 Tax=Caballeronia arvi TaxID=1777135 RepID=UPI00117FF5E3|nr:hypothetical protein [Caballeronia arvi]
MSYRTFCSGRRLMQRELRLSDREKRMWIRAASIAWMRHAFVRPAAPISSSQALGCFRTSRRKINGAAAF